MVGAKIFKAKIAALLGRAADSGSLQSANRRVRTLWLAVGGVVILLTPLALTFAGGGYVQFLGAHVVNTNTCCYYRWEPSSTVTASTWDHSWVEVTSSYSFSGWTGFWNSTAGSWVDVNHGAYDDIYLAGDAYGYPVITMLDGSYSLWFQSASDSSGFSWNSAELLLNNGGNTDFPSVAVNSSDDVAIAFDLPYSGYVEETVTWDSGTRKWTGPYYAASMPGRIVAVGSTFYFFGIDTSGNPYSSHLDKYTSTDNGHSWSGPVTLDTFTPPRPQSGVEFCRPQTSYCGYLDEPIWASAQGGGGPLGWVVAYPVAGANRANWVKFCALGISGCQTISYTADLFYPGITTSANGDLWLSMFTYTNSAPTLQQLAIYRTVSGSFLNAPAPTTINPTYWLYYDGSQGRCQGNPCFAAGEYVLPAMNSYTSATLPMIAYSSSRLTDLIQTFVQDPQSGAAPLPGLSVGPVIPFGSDSRVPIAAGQEGLHAWKPYRTGLSPNSLPQH